MTKEVTKQEKLLEDFAIFLHDWIGKEVGADLLNEWG